MFLTITPFIEEILNETRIFKISNIQIGQIILEELRGLKVGPGMLIIV